MGPQLQRCGRLPDALITVPPTSLQWGRNFSVAEGREGRDVSVAPTELQWGRNFSVAEGVGKPTAPDEGAELQWGRNFSVAEGARGTGA